MMTRSKPRVKPTRVSPRPPARFGAGLLGSTPTTRLSVPLSDLDWHSHIESIYETSWDEDAALEQRAAEAEACDRLSRGYIHGDLAEMIASTRI
jgi:hypothetical protein